MRSIERRALSCGALLTWLACSMGLHAATTVAPGIHLIPGATPPGVQPDGNSIILDAPRGLIVFDTGRHAAHTQQLVDFAAAAGRPVEAIINSHWHLDHTGGNVMLRERYPQVRIYASSALQDALTGFLADYRQQLQGAVAHAGSDSQAEAYRTEIALIDAGPKLLPTDVVSESGVRSIAGRRLEIHLEHGAVTAGDLWVFDPGTRVLLAGDLVTLPAPFLDTACPSRWQQALSHLEARRFRLLIPGHGTPMKMGELRAYHAAFDNLIACGASSRPKTECTEGWLNESPGLAGGTDREYARALVDYYVEGVLRGNAERLSKRCSA